METILLRFISSSWLPDRHKIESARDLFRHSEYAAFQLLNRPGISGDYLS